MSWQQRRQGKHQNESVKHLWVRIDNKFHSEQRPKRFYSYTSGRWFILLTEENYRGVWVRQFSNIRFFQRMPELMLPLPENSVTDA